MTLETRNQQQALVEVSLKLAFIKLQRVHGFDTVDGVKTPDRTAYFQILDAIRTFDPAFSFGDEPATPWSALNAKLRASIDTLEPRPFGAVR